MNKLLQIISLGVLIFLSCETPRTPPLLDKKWFLDQTPNEFDTVGTVYAIDENKEPVYIPGVNLDVKAIKSATTLSKEFRENQLCWGTLLNFLGKLIDTTLAANVNHCDSTTVTFQVHNPTLMRIGSEISEAFSKRKGEIEANIKIYGLQRSKLFLVVEAIQSNNVSIRLDKKENWKGNLDAQYRNIVNLHPSLDSKSSTNSDFDYTAPKSLTFFYKLRPIFLDSVVAKGNGEVKYIVTLADSLIERNEK